MQFADVSSCEPEFDAAATAANPGLEGRTVCLGLSPYYGFSFAPIGRGPAEWIAKRVSVGDGAHGSVSCGGAVTVGDACTALVATYEGPGRNSSSANRPTVTLEGDPRFTFTLTGLQGILYSGQGMRVTGYRRDGGSVSTVLAPSEVLNPVFPPQQWSGLVTLEFVPDVGSGGWAIPDDVTTLKIFWLNATVC